MKFLKVKVKLAKTCLEW